MYHVPPLPRTAHALPSVLVATPFPLLPEKLSQEVNQNFRSLFYTSCPWHETDKVLTQILRIYCFQDQHQVVYLVPASRVPTQAAGMNYVVIPYPLALFSAVTISASMGVLAGHRCRKAQLSSNSQTMKLGLGRGTVAHSSLVAAGVTSSETQHQSHDAAVRRVLLTLLSKSHTRKSPDTEDVRANLTKSERWAAVQSCNAR